MKYAYCAAAFFTMLATLSTVQAGDTYKWKDDKGQVVYTDTPPRDRPFEVIKQRKYDTSAPVESPKPTSNSGKPETTASVPTTNGKAPQTEAERKQANCDIAKRNQKTLTEVTRIKVTENGQERMLSDEERVAKIKAVEKDMQYWCEGK